MTEGANQSMADVRARIEGVKAAQQEAMRATGEASSHDGSVHAVVDATGVVTALRMAPTAFDDTTPERLAQTVVATIQQAAAAARGRMSEALAPVQTDPKVAETVAQGLASLGIRRMPVPEVPRTAADPTTESWSAQPEAPQPPRPQRTGGNPEADGDFADERPW